MQSKTEGRAWKERTEEGKKSSLPGGTRHCLGKGGGRLPDFPPFQMWE